MYAQVHYQNFCIPVSVIFFDLTDIILPIFHTIYQTRFLAKDLIIFSQIKFDTIPVSMVCEHLETKENINFNVNLSKRLPCRFYNVSVYATVNFKQNCTQSAEVNHLSPDNQDDIHFDSSLTKQSFPCHMGLYKTMKIAHATKCKSQLCIQVKKTKSGHFTYGN